MEQYLKSFKEN
jgi:hypothetical protein